MTVTLNSLSDPILLNIRSFLLGDIVAHVALENTCTTLRKLYANEDDTFWQLECFSAGFGRPRRRGDPNEQPTWRAVTHALANHSLKCEIRSCRDAHLYFAENYRVSSRTSIQTPIPSRQGVTFHPLYYYLHCNELSPRESSTFVPVPDAISILLTHLPTFPECRTSQYGPLCSHPNASCVFATWPPRETLNFYDGNGHTFLSIHNPDGCTILDINRALADLIPREPGTPPIDAAMAHYHDLVQASGLSFIQFAEHGQPTKRFSR
ncbi:hypothetical protein QCA50_016583 [Cerrena zonata]|uniref:F-box domain-containing protein n=1 Tax=Cerrena zonata TaxID=2478898 RepID=A0AAW0FS42_9APHY